MEPGSLFAISDLHVSYPENRELVEGLRPASDADWLIVAGDVGEKVADVEWTLGRLRELFGDPLFVRHPKGVEPTARALALAPAIADILSRAQSVLASPAFEEGVEVPVHVDELGEVILITGSNMSGKSTFLRTLGINLCLAYAGGPVAVCPLFLLYDYTWRAGTPGATTKEQALAHSRELGVVCTDEMLLHPDPYPSREAWCRARVAQTEARLAALDVPTVLVNHFPLVEEPTRILRYPVFAQWCGTRLTADWPVRFRAKAVVYGHLHIPRTTTHDGVPHHEVSVGYPREWRRRGGPRGPVRVLPA